MTKSILTQAELKAVLHYDRITGIFIWLSRDRGNFNSKRGFIAWNARYSGAIAGCVSNVGNGKRYIVIRLNKQNYYAHRLACLYVNGEFPFGSVDHEDGNGLKNKWKNIRSATHQENMKNVKKRIDNTSGYVGVCWDKDKRKWHSQIGVSGKNINLGYFLDKSDAIYARNEGEVKYGFHKNHGAVRPH